LLNIVFCAILSAQPLEPGFKKSECLTMLEIGTYDYYKLFPDDPQNIFIHHFHDAYYYLARKLPDTNSLQAP
jgi:hypothetical protein